MLNVTSKARLDVLLAGLLDNSSSGVNGTFESVTNQVPFLGLDSAVTAGLANRIVLSDGLNGPPQSSYPPPPPPSSGLWGDFVNAVSSVIQTVAGAIVSLVNVVFTAVLAAYTFIAHLAREAADFGGQLLARVAATLVSIGDSILAALSKLLTWLADLIEGLLSTVLGPIVAGIDQYESGLASALQRTYNDSQANRSITSDVAQFWQALGAPVFWIVTAIAIAVTIVITIAEDFSFGAGFVLPLILGVILSGSLLTLATVGGPTFMSDFAMLDPISPEVATALEDLFDPPASLVTVGSILALGTTSAAALNIQFSWSQGEDADIGDLAGFGFGALGLLVGAAAGHFDSPWGAGLSLYLDACSLTIDYQAIKARPDIENLLTLFIDGGATAIDAHTFGIWPN